ncbi:hypothetical protein E3N88_43899 [Mikania micrantha]|uniref:NB-ARC domain-containing protein n=1 Tax=Mikania micrantha TaxID=192012 RepID=A0A5N6LDJ9_9ASTR|nr:hypothetical protein E3N88_43899 [Mikania micrantha]
MGRDIVRRLHPRKPNRLSRLWVKREIENILYNDLGTEDTKSMNMRYLGIHPAIVMTGLRKMKKIIFLSVLKMLKFVDLSYSKLRTFDLGMTRNLETLDLRSCIDLVELQIPSALPMLKDLNLSGSKIDEDLVGTLPVKECSSFLEIDSEDDVRMIGICGMGDDVDDISQLEALAGNPNWFKPGSRIIITTRDRQVLKAHEFMMTIFIASVLLSEEEALVSFNN